MDPQHPIDIGKALGSAAAEPGGAEVPSNPIVVEALETVREKQAALPISELSPAGQAVQQAFDETLRDTERLVEEKNRNDLLQRFVACAKEVGRLQGSDVGRGALKKMVLSEGGEPLGWLMLRDERWSDRIQAVAKTAVTSTQFREMVSEAIAIVQQMLVRASSQMEGIEYSQPLAGGGGEGEGTKEEVREEGKKVEVREEGKKVEESFAEVVATGTGGAELEQPVTIRKEVAEERLISRFLDLVGQMQSNPEYRDAVILFSRRAAHLKDVVRVPQWEERLQELQPGESHVVREITGNVDEMMRLLKELIENLTNSSVDDVIQTWGDIDDQLGNDDEAQAALQRAGSWLERCLTDAEYWEDKDGVRVDSDQIVEDVRLSVLEKYRPRVEHLLSQFRYYVDRMRRDPLAKKLSGDISTLTSHLFYDEKGNPKLKPELLMDLTKIVPAILRNLRYIKIPDIVVQEPGLDFVASNVVINVSELAPHHLRLVLESDLPEREGERALNLIEFEMSRIHAEAKDARFLIDKSGLPPLNDAGHFDFRVFEEGMYIKLWLQPIVGTVTTGGGQSVTAGLQVTKCDCRLDGFDLSVHGSGHDWMYYLLGPYIRRRVKARFEEAVQKYFLESDLMAERSISTAIDRAEMHG